MVAAMIGAQKRLRELVLDPFQLIRQRGVPLERVDLAADGSALPVLSGLRVSLLPPSC